MTFYIFLTNLFWQIFLIGTLNSILQATNATISKDSNDVSNNIENLSKQVESLPSSIISTENKSKVLSVLSKELSTKFGTNLESKTAEKVVKDKIVPDTSKVSIDENYYTLSLLKTNVYEYVIVGRIDRIEIDENNKGWK